MHFETMDEVRDGRFGQPSYLGGRASRRTTGKDATAKECAFECTVAVHTAPAKACHFSRGKHIPERGAIGLEHARRKVGLQTTQRLAREDP